MHTDGTLGCRMLPAEPNNSLHMVLVVPYQTSMASRHDKRYIIACQTHLGVARVGHRDASQQNTLLEVSVELLGSTCANGPEAGSTHSSTHVRHEMITSKYVAFVLTHMRMFPGDRRADPEGWLFEWELFRASAAKGCSVVSHPILRPCCTRIAYQPAVSSPPLYGLGVVATRSFTCWSSRVPSSLVSLARPAVCGVGLHGAPLKLVLLHKELRGFPLAWSRGFDNR